LRSAERSREKLYDEVQELKRKLKDQQRVNKETDDKYYRYKDCIYRSKVHLNKLQDEFNEILKKNEKAAAKTDQAVTQAKEGKPELSNVSLPCVENQASESACPTANSQKQDGLTENAVEPVCETEKIADSC
jgi:hypothetical protein